MRLSKKIAAVALAAVMSVSLLTACGGTDAPSSSNPGSSSSSSSSSADSSSSSSSSGSASDSSSSSSGSGSSSNSGTEDKEENIAYKNSRTARFYQKLGTSYTLGSKLDITANNKSETVDMLVVTNGSRTYQQATAQSKGSTESQIVLTDLTKQKKWNLASVEDDITKEQGKLGYYYSAPISGTSTGGGVPGNVMPIEGLKFKQETKGDYYIESQSYAASSNGEKVEIFIAYYFKGNDSAPEYVDVKESLGSKGTATIRVTFTRIEYKADAKYLDFETILKQYIDVTDKMPSTVQAQEPSVASLILG
jgi:uncharacterized lipoprotein YehR (DUF1307 family)